MTTKLSKKITQRREELGLNYTEVAAACKVSEVAVRGWEADSYRPRDEKLPALAKVLKLKLAELVGA